VRRAVLVATTCLLVSPAVLATTTATISDASECAGQVGCAPDIVQATAVYDASDGNAFIELTFAEPLPLLSSDAATPASTVRAVFGTTVSDGHCGDIAGPTFATAPGSG
jgi:hypothetical protein